MAERARLGELLRGLAPGDWERQTGCAGWTVRDVVAHLVAWDDVLAYETPFGQARALARWTGAMAKVRFDPAGFNRRAVEQAPRAPSELLRRFEVDAGPGVRWLFERSAPGAQLAEYVVHRCDVALPLQRPVHVDDRTLAAALDGVTRVPGLGARRLLRRRRWVATDIEWARGHGEEVRAPALDLLLALAGRDGGQVHTPAS